MKLGIIGCGRFGERRAIPAAFDLGIEVAAISRRNQSEAERIQKAWNIPYTALTTKELLSHVDAVWITSAHQQHEEDALMCAAAGIPTLCEKPLALTGKSALTIAQAFEGLPLLVGHYLRFKEAVLKAREMIAGHAFGELKHIDVHYSIPLDRSNWRYQFGGSIQDLGVHLIDLVRFLTNDEVSQASMNGDTVTAHIFLELESKVTASLCCSFEYAFASSFEVIGTKGRLVSKNSLRQTYDPVETLQFIQEDDSILTFPLRAENPYAFQLQHFLDVCQKKVDPLVTGNDGVANAQVIDQLFR